MDSRFNHVQAVTPGWIQEVSSSTLAGLRFSAIVFSAMSALVPMTAKRHGVANGAVVLIADLCSLENTMSRRPFGLPMMSAPQYSPCRPASEIKAYSPVGVLYSSGMQYRSLSSESCFSSSTCSLWLIYGMTYAVEPCGICREVFSEEIVMGVLSSSAVI